MATGATAYLELGCSAGAKCSRCMQIYHLAGSGAAQQHALWGAYGGCMPERVALAELILRAWLCEEREKARLGVGAYWARRRAALAADQLHLRHRRFLHDVASATVRRALGTRAPPSANHPLGPPDPDPQNPPNPPHPPKPDQVSGALGTCADLGLDEVMGNVHGDDFYIAHSESLGFHCALTHDMLWPHKVRSAPHSPLCSASLSANPAASFSPSQPVPPTQTLTHAVLPHRARRVCSS